ncbi:hypothetical protein CATYP_07860 [Corynebacterium atypicum]|uniref:Uncharacterized protein n=1 Tax=Corynebacterium atypicum TaxID=191610 RepID=A0ABM5QNV5_9CORY|nr:hypothetical protein [Corynebacterium atypicum]AIG64517.1 hypothetical protein CATYP_07860 [Corynebacterium atypicum]
MQRFAAQLRHRELTQELYDIGDEVAGYLENLAEAITDFDAELAEDCLAEFDIIAGEGRADSRVVLGELMGLNQALTSGVRSGTISAKKKRRTLPAPPEAVTAASLALDFPLDASPVPVAELSLALDRRTQAVTDYLAGLVDYLLAVTAAAAEDVESPSYPHALQRIVARVHGAVEAWQVLVARAHPAYARARRGAHPPTFLAERARVNAIVARVAARRQRANGTGGAAG